MSKVAVRHAAASGGDIRETQHEEERVRDIQIIKGGSEAAGEEQQYDSSMKLRVHQHLQIQLLLWNFLHAVKHKVNRCPYL